MSFGRSHFFEGEVRDIDPEMRRLDPTQCDQPFGTSRHFYLSKQTDLDQWKRRGLTSNVPGATFRCTENKSVLTKQWVEIFPSLVDSSQFKTVVIHELGHSLGLDHSCINEEGKPDFKSCKNIDKKHDYYQALMYPTLRKSRLDNGQFESKEDLKNNDLIRAACLYAK